MSRNSYIVCPIVWAEVRGCFEDAERMHRAFHDAEIHFDPFDRECAELAGRLWRKYRRRGGSRTRLIADFLIGAHAQVRGGRLLTRDRGFFRRYFTGLLLIAARRLPLRIDVLICPSVSIIVRVKLTISEAAALLDSSEERVHDWIEEAALPAQKIRGQYRINRTDLLEWATAHRIAVAPRAFGHDRGTVSLADALRAGGIHDWIAGSDLATILPRIVALLPLGDSVDRDMLLQILLARDKLGVTPVGDGIAIPHALMPIVLAPANAILALCFLTTPLDLHAPDGRAVDTLFLLVCPTVHVHLAMLARLAWGLKNEAFRAAVRGHAPADEIVRIAATLEEVHG